MKKLTLSKDEYALVDDDDFERVSRYKWSLATAKGKKYARRTIKYGKCEGKWKQKQIYLHRFILDADSSVQIDHINGDGLDNRKSNLRLCNQRQNLINKVSPLHKKGKYRGVSYFRDSLSKPWVARIGINKKTVHLGYFKTNHEAAAAYNGAALEHFGEFAHLNTIPEESVCL